MSVETLISPTMYMTSRGLTKLEAELSRLRIRRTEYAQYASEAYSGGDSIDNTEYILLRDELAFLDGRILEIEDILRHAEIIDRGADDGKVHLGNTVVVQCGDVPVETYTITGSAEADPSQGFISNVSPLGRALLEHGVGDVVLVTSPDGTLQFRILAVT